MKFNDDEEDVNVLIPSEPKKFICWICGRAYIAHGELKSKVHKEWYAHHSLNECVYPKNLGKEG